MMTKHKIGVWLMRIAMVLLLITLWFMAISCGGKKKIIEESEFKKEIAAVEKVNVISQNDIKTTQNTGIKSESLSITENSDVQLTQADPNKEIVLIDSNGKKTVIRGANAIVRKNTTVQKVTDTFRQNLSKIDLSKIDLTKNKQIESKASGSDKNIDIEKQGKFPWWWLLIALVVYGVVSYLRKSLNPLGWF